MARWYKLALLVRALVGHHLYFIEVLVELIIVLLLVPVIYSYWLARPARPRPGGWPGVPPWPGLAWPGHASGLAWPFIARTFFPLLFRPTYRYIRY
jgi:hypothetical protein